MSLFIHSEDHKTGSSSSGSWEFNANLKGSWKVIGQHMESQSYPWLWAGQNQMVVKSFNPEDILEFVIFGITFNPSLGLVTDLTQVALEIQTTMQAAFDFQGAINIWANRTITVTYNSTNDTLFFEIDDDPIDVLWTYDNGLVVSSINPSFNLAPDISDLINVEFFSVTTDQMIIDPKYLEVYIEESNTQYATAFGARPNLFFSTRDGEFLGQQFSIGEDTNTLTIQIKKLHSSIVVPITAEWYLVCSQSG